MAFLEVRDLRLHYGTPQGTLKAVDGVSFLLPVPGEALGIIGATGSGKTSLLCALTRLLPRATTHHGGEVLLEGADLMRLSSETFRRHVRWRKIAIVPQGAASSFNPVLKIGAQVAERALAEPGADSRKVRAEAEELLASVGLPRGTYDRYPHELSGGMKQRAAIAMALTLHPPLLMLDEPTSALDVSVQAQIMNVLKRLKWERGITMILITHDIALASDLCDRIAVMHAGRIREEGPAEQVLLEPRDTVTRELIASVPRLGDSARPPIVLPGRPPRALAADSARSPDAPLAPSVQLPHTELPHAPPAPSALLSVERLSVRFQARTGLFRTKTVRAVDGVTLSIGRGETLSLVGESGSGKTTVGRAMLRLVDPAEGTVRFGGADIAGLRGPRLKAFRRKAQAVPQDPYASISPFMDAREIVEEPLRIHGFRDAARREELVLRALEKVKLEPAREVAAAYPHSLSGGQRQRVCIARAIVLEPEFVVADEPVSMVDASHRIGILSLLRELQAALGIAFLYITHDLASARHFSDRIAVLYLGTVVESGPTAEVVEDPWHPYSVALLASVPEPDPANRGRLRATISGEPPRADAVPPGCPFHPRCPHTIKGLCDVERPVLQELAPGHSVACHLYSAGRT